MKYLKLLYKLDQDEVVKEESNRNYYRYYFGEEKWNPTTIMAEYFWPDSNKCDEYMEISESEALALIDEQRERYDHLLELAIDTAKKAFKRKKDKNGIQYIEHYRAVAETLTHTEYKIVAYLYGVCENTSVSFDKLNDLGFTYRIVNSVRILTQMDILTYEQYLNRLRYDYAARAVKIADLKYITNTMRVLELNKKDDARLRNLEKSIAFLESSEIMKPDFKIE